MSIQKGKKGEETAVQYLLSQGVEVLTTNYHGGRFGEIDIIGKENELYLFIEVKSFKQGSMLSPKEAVTEQKQEKIKRTTEHYLEKNGLQQVPCRFDVLELLWDQEKIKEINWLKDAFR